MKKPATMMLYGYNADGKRVREYPLNIDPRDPNFFLGLAPDGRTILFAGKDGLAVDRHLSTGLTLHTKQIDNADAKPFDTKIPVERGMIVRPSPGGKLIAVNRYRELEQHHYGQDCELFDLSTGKKREVKLPDDIHIASWSPDSNWFFATWLDPEIPPKMVTRKTKMFKVFAANGKAEELPKDFPFENFVSSPNGKSLLGVIGDYEKDTYRPIQHIRRSDWESKTVTPVLSFKRAVSAHGVWSPDSKKVAIACRFADADPQGGGLMIKDKSLSIVVCDTEGKNSKTIFEVKDDECFQWIFCGWTP